MTGTPQGTNTYSGQLAGALAAISAVPSNLCAITVGNPDSSTAYLQLFDAPMTGDGAPTLGITTPNLSLMIPAGQTLPIVLPGGQQITFQNAITAAATTTPTGATPAGSALVVNAIYR